MEYMILTNHDVGALAEAVQKLLDEGWNLQGGVGVGRGAGGITFAQALVRGLRKD
jgi:hypothetical protein